MRMKEMFTKDVAVCRLHICSTLSPNNVRIPFLLYFTRRDFADPEVAALAHHQDVGVKVEVQPLVYMNDFSTVLSRENTFSFMCHGNDPLVEIRRTEDPDEPFVMDVIAAGATPYDPRAWLLVTLTVTIDTEE